MFVDSHCHLDFDDFAPELSGVVQRAQENGIEHMLTISCKVSDYDRVRNVADQFDNIHCTVGTHPHDALEELDVPLEKIIELSHHEKVVGIGETGLDYFYDNSPREEQKQSFRKHIKACLATDLPIIIHTRDAEADTIQILDEESPDRKLRGVMHCFTASEDMAMKSLERGFYISMSGIVTFKRSTELQEIAKKIPLDRLLIETDAPFLAPVPKRGKRNEPSFVRHTAEFLAELKGISVEELAKATTENFYTLFSKIER